MPTIMAAVKLSASASRLPSSAETTDNNSTDLSHQTSTADLEVFSDVACLLDDWNEDLYDDGSNNDNNTSNNKGDNNNNNDNDNDKNNTCPSINSKLTIEHSQRESEIGLDSVPSVIESLRVFNKEQENEFDSSGSGSSTGRSENHVNDSDANDNNNDSDNTSTISGN
eukprot:Pgem_evm1s18480